MVSMVQGEFRFVIHPKDYESTVGFYRDGLGLPVRRSWDRGPGDRGTLFEAASGVIEIWEISHEHGSAAAEAAGMAFGVEDVETWYQRAREKRPPIREALSDKPWRHRSFSLSDPNGITVTLFATI